MTAESLRYALGVSAAAALLAGCGALPLSSSKGPAVAQLPVNAVPETKTLPVPANHGTSWMEAGAAKHDLLYVTDGAANVYVYTYPQGRHVGTLTGFISPLGECTDAAGDVFIVSSNGGKGSLQSAIITEYAHGGKKPILTLTVSQAGSGCTVDPSTGNLAVAGSWDYYGQYLGAVSTYTASGEQLVTIYTRSFNAFSMCGYDAQGNLYLSSEAGSHEEDLVRLPADTSDGFQAISVNEPLYAYHAPVSVQWDGTYVTVSSTPDRSPIKLYRLSISGNSATVVGTTILSSRSNFRKTSQVWIQGNSVVDADYFKGDAGIDRWTYPRAAKPERVLPNSIRASLYGVAISPAGNKEK